MYPFQMRLTFILCLLFLNSLLAQNNEFANIQANSQILRETKQKAFACYKTIVQDTTILGEKTDSYQIVKTKKNIYRVELFQSRQGDMVKVFKNGTHLKDLRLKDSELNFRTSNISLSKASQELQSVECYIGSKTYFINYDDSRPFVLHNHVQSRYYGQSEEFTKWYFRYANNFKIYPNFVLLDGYSVGKSYKITSFQLKANNAPYRKSDLLTGHLNESSYKVAPSGNLHITFGHRFTGSVIVMGTAYNYCITNLFISLARALLSSERTTLRINLPGHYNHYQETGLTKKLDIHYPTTSSDLKTLIEEEPFAFSRFFEKQKKYIENELKNEVEVLLKGQKVKTKKPKLILNIF